MNLAAGICAKFRLDPVDVIKGSWFDWSVRRAAFELVIEGEKKAHEEAKSK